MGAEHGVYEKLKSGKVADVQTKREALGNIAEFIFQASVTCTARGKITLTDILGRMDLSDTAFKETLRAAGLLKIHDDLKKTVEMMM